MTSKTVLIVEDEAAIAAVIAHKLRAAGLRCVHASDAHDALRAGRERGVDLVISDLHLPGMSGVELARRIATQPWGSGVPVLLISGSGSALASTCSEPNVRGFIAKPFSPRDVLERVTAALESTREATALESGAADV